MATLHKHRGLFGNSRLEYLLTKLYASPLAELQELGAAAQRALDDLIPSFVRRARTERGRAYQASCAVRKRVADLLSGRAGRGRRGGAGAARR